MSGEYNSEVCKKNRESINEKINVLFERDEDKEKRLKNVEMILSEFKSIPQTLIDIRNDLKELAPTVTDNKFWVDKFKQACFWISVMAVGGGLAAIVFKIIHKLLGFVN